MSEGLDPAYRNKVLQPRAGFRRDAWMTVPHLTWVARQPEVDVQQQTKLVCRWLMAAVDETIGAAGTALQFVVLLGVEEGEGQRQYTIICPYDAPLELMGRGEARTGEYLPRIAEIDIEFHFGAIVGIKVPVVLSCDRSAGRYAFENANQLQAPRQFINPFWCRTTSGFLNFLGAREIDGAEMFLLSNVDALEDQGLDEWFRWLYCTMETGTTFDTGRLLVRVDEPETWVYDYDGN